MPVTHPDRRLIYIIGAGRSGTTLLDIVLGNSSSSFSAGELNRYPKRNGVPPLSEPESERFKYWASFTSKLIARRGNRPNYPEIQALCYRNEHHLSYLKAIRSKQQYAYAAYIFDFYSTLFEHCAAPVIIESSKYPARALNLSQIISDLTRIDYVYIKRNPIDVVSSFKKKDVEQPAKNWLTANVYYFFVNLLCALTVAALRRRGHACAIVTFEQLTKDAPAALRRISDEIDLDLSEPIRLAESQCNFHVGLLFDGNRIRNQESVRLRSASNKRPAGVSGFFTRLLQLPVYFRD